MVTPCMTRTRMALMIVMRHMTPLRVMRHDHGLMVAELKRRFWISLLLTLPILILSPVIQHALGLGAAWRFSGDTYVLAVLASAIYFYGGWPFLQGLKDEISSRNLGMMMLIGVAITAAYIYSLATLLGLPGNDFFWELVTHAVGSLDRDEICNGGGRCVGESGRAHSRYSAFS